MKYTQEKRKALLKKIKISLKFISLISHKSSFPTSNLDVKNELKEKEKPISFSEKVARRRSQSTQENNNNKIKEQLQQLQLQKQYYHSYHLSPDKLKVNSDSLTSQSICSSRSVDSTSKTFTDSSSSSPLTSSSILASSPTTSDHITINNTNNCSNRRIKKSISLYDTTYLFFKQRQIQIEQQQEEYQLQQHILNQRMIEIEQQQQQQQEQQVDDWFRIPEDWEINLKYLYKWKWREEMVQHFKRYRKLRSKLILDLFEEQNNNNNNFNELEMYKEQQQQEEIIEIKKEIEEEEEKNFFKLPTDPEFLDQLLFNLDQLVLENQALESLSDIDINEFYKDNDDSEMDSDTTPSSSSLITIDNILFSIYHSQGDNTIDFIHDLILEQDININHHDQEIDSTLSTPPPSLQNNSNIRDNINFLKPVIDTPIIKRWMVQEV